MERVTLMNIDKIRALTEENKTRILREEIDSIESQIKKQAYQGQNSLYYCDIFYPKEIKEYFLKLGFQTKIITNLHDYCDSTKDIEIRW